MIRDCSSFSKGNRQAFSLLEVVIVLAVVGILAAAGFSTMSDVSQPVKVAKAQADVDSLNRAVQVYLASGGTLDQNSDLDMVMQKLRSRENSETADSLVGLGGTKIDTRLRAVPVSREQEGLPGIRITWNNSSRRFEVAENATGPGIASFEAQPDGDSDQISEETLSDNAFHYARKGNWIWDYSESPAAPSVAAASPSTPTLPSTAPSPATVIPPSTPVPTPPPPPPLPPVPAPSRLSPPSFSIAPGAQPLNQFPLGLRLNNPNPASISSIKYRINGGAVWQDYSVGDVLPISMKDTIDAYAASNQTRVFTDSLIVGGNYWADPVTLVLELTADKDTVSYFDLVEGTIRARARVTNLNAIPAALRSTSFYEIFWTSDGSGPSASAGGAFKGDVPGDPSVVKLGPAMWKGTASLVLRSIADTGVTEWAKSSAIQTKTISASVIQLPIPAISVRDLGTGQYAVEMTPSGKVPADTPIYYTTDGTVPNYQTTGGSGNIGTSYSGPFIWTPAAPTSSSPVTSTLKAKAFTPDGLETWFVASAMASSSVTITPPAAGGGLAAMVKEQLTMDGSVVGNIQVLNPSSVMINSSTRLTGDLLVAGTPSVTVNGSPQFSGVVPGSGAAQPSGYTVMINSGAQLGRLMTRTNPLPFPTLNHPPAGSGNWITIDSPARPANWFPNSGVNLNPQAGQVQLPPGTYGDFTASNNSNGGKVILGNSGGGSANYYFNSFTLNSGVPLEVIGPVVIHTREFTINGGSNVGSASTKDRLTINVSGNQFIDNANAKLFAKSIHVPNGSTYINGSVSASITTKNLTVNSSGTLTVK